jgi:Tol biopolymer transport system component
VKQSEALSGLGCWSPDGKFIAYLVKRGDDAFLMLMPSNGGESIQLTLGHGRSWPYSFSPDWTLSDRIRVLRLS